LWIAAVDWATPLSANPEPERTAVRHYELSAFPNPFNSSVRIAFDLPRAGDVGLYIYDVLGRQVTTLMNQPLAAGAHAVTWSPNGTAGIYFITLHAGQETRVEKIMYLK
jgi:Tol biopolymer transport system component